MAVEVIGTIKPKNGKDFPVVEAADVKMPDGARLGDLDLSAAGEAPTFDLVALGLPTVSVDAGFVGVTCDTTEMRAALDRGAVQFKVKLGNINDGSEYEATILMGSIETGESMFTCSCRVSGNYTVSNTLATDDLAELTVMVVETGVMAVLTHLLHVPLVDEDSNGKVLTVVDGAWMAADAPSGGSDIVVDTALSDTSENPVQNKVVAQAFLSYGQEFGAIIEEISQVLPPNVTEDDNGKVLTVVDGAWTAVAVADSSIKTYVDDYINEALGGEY